MFSTENRRLAPPARTARSPDASTRTPAADLDEKPPFDDTNSANAAEPARADGALAGGEPPGRGVATILRARTLFTRLVWKPAIGDRSREPAVQPARADGPLSAGEPPGGGAAPLASARALFARLARKPVLDDLHTVPTSQRSSEDKSGASARQSTLSYAISLWGKAPGGGEPDRGKKVSLRGASCSRA